MTSITANPSTVHAKIQAFAKTVASQEVRILTVFPVGKSVRQGDIYLRRLKDTPAGITYVTDQQLAPGTTQGSRHVAEGARVATIEGTDHLPKKLVNDLGNFARHMVGPIVVADKTFTVTHPEHAHMRIEVPGTYQVLYQLDHVRQERVRD